MLQRAEDVADLHRFRAKAVRWVEFQPPLKKLDVRRKQDCFGDCRATSLARDESLYTQGLMVDWDFNGEEYGYGVVDMQRVYSAGLGREIFLGICPRCQTVHWSEIVRLRLADRA